MALFFLLPALVLFKLMTTYLKKDMYEPVHDDFDEDDEFEYGGISRQGNNALIDFDILLKLFKNRLIPKLLGYNK